MALVPNYVIYYFQDFYQLGEGATNVFQSNLRIILVAKISRFWSSKLRRKFRGNVVVGVWLVAEGVDGSDRIFGRDKMSHDISTGSFTKFGSPWMNACVMQCGRHCVEVGGIEKGFQELVWKLVLILKNPMEYLECFVVKLFVVMGLLWIVLLERSKVFGDGDDGKVIWTLGVAKFLFLWGWITSLIFVNV